MFWFFVRLAFFQLFAVFLCTVMALSTLWLYSIERIDTAYEREIAALRFVGIGEDPELRLPIEVRAQNTSNAIITFFEGIMREQPASAPKHQVTSAIEESIRNLINNRWWLDTKPLLKRFLPVAYIRLETYYTIALPLCPLMLVAFFIGQAEGKQRIREGYHKRNFLPHYLRYGFGFLRDLTVACTGLVIFPPVVWWVLPVVLISCLMTYLWRAYSIQIA